MTADRGAAALRDGDRDPSWPEGFYWSEAEGRPMYRTVDAAGHSDVAWMESPAEADTAAELIVRFKELSECPQLVESEGMRCCAICLDELGWLALDLIPRLIGAPDG